jgi:hypothetical protein
MKKSFSIATAAFVFTTLLLAAAEPVSAGRGSLATIAGSVSDAQGNPLSGALISLLREGAKEVAKEIRTDASGKFSAKVAPGRYSIRAIAQGFSEVAFASVQVRASQELRYRFNLQPVGSGRTLPEQRRDRDDMKWTLRSAHTRRSIFQIQDEESTDIGAIASGDTAANETPVTEESDEKVRTFDRRPQGIIETYFATSPYGFAYSGLNFAVVAPASADVEFAMSGQTGVGPGAPERFEALGRIRAGQRHRIGANVAGMRFATPLWTNNTTDSPTLGQFSVRAVDEWIVRNGVVIVFGLDYSRFIGGSGAHSISPRLGVQFDANSRTRLHAAFVPGGQENRVQSIAGFESTQVVFSEEGARPVAYIDGQAVMERSHRLEFGIERVLDNNSNLEASAFFDTTNGRGVGLLSVPLPSLSGTTGENLITVANQQGAARGMRVVYNRRLSHLWSASAGYAFGRGQRLSPDGLVNPSGVFSDGLFQTAAFQIGAGFPTGTHVRTVLRFSPEATVFAIDPFAGRLGVYDPSLSIQVTQELPSFGLPVRAEAIIDARNLMDTQATAEGSEILTQLSTGRRSVRGGISLRF